MLTCKISSYYNHLLCRKWVTCIKYWLVCKIPTKKEPNLKFWSCLLLSWSISDQSFKSIPLLVLEIWKRPILFYRPVCKIHIRSCDQLFSVTNFQVASIWLSEPIFIQKCQRANMLFKTLLLQVLVCKIHTLQVAELKQV